MKKLLISLFLILLFDCQAFSQTVYDDNYQENPNYLQGNKYLKNSQYSSAIAEYKKALRANPEDNSSLIGLSNAYNMRAAYYNNTVKATDNAISDLKSALFYLKYFSVSSSVSPQTVNSIQNNLSLLEKSKKQVITPQDRYNTASAYRTKGEFAASAYDYFQLINDNTYAFKANSALGDIYKILNSPQKAVSFYQRALNIKSGNSDIHLKLARTYEQLNDYSSALKEYGYALNDSDEKEDILSSLEKIWQKKVDEAPKDAEAHANLGVVFQKQKRYNEAIAEYQKAEALNPSNINTKINIASLYQEEKRYESAIAVYDSILKLQPYNTKVLIYKAQCMKQLNRNDNAIELYKTALNTEPDNTEIKAQLFELLKNKMPADELLAYLYKNSQNTPVSADTLYEFAYELHKSNKIDDAIKYYLQTIKLDNTKVDAYINLSQAYRQKNNYTEAYNIIKKAKAVAPDNELVKKQIAVIENDNKAQSLSLASNLYQSGEYQKAIDEYMKITPPTSDSLIGIAAAYQALKNNANAIEYYKKAMQIDTKNSDLPYYIASLYINNGDMENAKKYAQTAVNLNPSNSQAKEILNYISAKEDENKIANAVNLYEQKKYNDALNIFNSLQKTNSDNSAIYYYRALCYDALNNYQKAIDEYKSVIKYAPDMVIAYYSIAVDYDNLNNYKLAKQNYKKYTELSLEDSEYRTYALQRLEDIK